MLGEAEEMVPLASPSIRSTCYFGLDPRSVKSVGCLVQYMSFVIHSDRNSGPFFVEKLQILGRGTLLSTLLHFGTTVLAESFPKYPWALFFPPQSFEITSLTFVNLNTYQSYILVRISCVF